MVKTNNSTSPGVLTAVRDFMQLESAGGILLLAAAVIALLVANSPLAALYDSLLDTTGCYPGWGAVDQQAASPLG